MNVPDLGIYSPERAFSILLLQLGELVEKGKGDDAEADDLREQMGEYWNALSEDPRQRMRWLSEDLADLGKGGPQIVHTNPEAIQRWKDQLNDALIEKEKGNHDRFLATLRSPAQTQLPISELVFLQARAWDDAGFPEVSIHFLKFAEKTDPSIAIYTLNKLQREGYISEAIEKANRLLSERSDDPLAVYFSSAVLLESIRHHDSKIARPTLERIVAPLRRTLDKLIQNQAIETQTRAFMASIASILGLCLEWLGQNEAALKVYDQMLSREPNSPEALTMRGLARMKGDTNLAMEDLRRAIQNHTRSPWPFIIVSRNQLGSNNLQAVSLCNQALNSIPRMSDTARAFLYEGIAIGYAALGQSKDRVLDNFYSALDLHPDDDRIRKNLVIYLAGRNDYDISAAELAKAANLPVNRFTASRLVKQPEENDEKGHEAMILGVLAA